MIRNSILIALLACLAPAVAQEAPASPDLSYSFTADEGWDADKLASTFVLNADAQTDGSVTVDPAKTKRFTGCLRLVDLGPGSPSITLPLATEVPTGELAARLGTFGNQGQSGKVTLLGDGKELASLRLKNNSVAILTAGDETPRTIDYQGSWYHAPCRFTMAWHVDPADGQARLTLTFEPRTKGADPVVIADVPMAAAVAVDAIRFEVGFPKAVNRGLLIDAIELTATQPEK